MKKIAFLLAIMVYASSLTGCGCYRRIKGTLCRGAYCGTQSAAIGAPVRVAAPAPMIIQQPAQYVAAPQVYAAPCCECPPVSCDPCCDPCGADYGVGYGGGSIGSVGSDCGCNGGVVGGYVGEAGSTNSGWNNSPAESGSAPAINNDPGPGA